MPEPRTWLPARRPNATVTIDDAATGWWNLTAGFDETTGRVAEIFLDQAHRAGSAFDSLVHDLCIIVSRDLLQRGHGCAELIRKLSDRPPSLIARALAEAADLEERLGPLIAAQYRERALLAQREVAAVREGQLGFDQREE